MKLGGFWFHFINFQIRAKESVFMKKTKRKYLQNMRRGCEEYVQDAASASLVFCDITPSTTSFGSQQRTSRKDLIKRYFFLMES